MQRNSFVVFALMLTACSPLRGCVESNFTLDINSRLPVWFTLPPLVPRADTNVTMDLWSNGDAEFEFRNSRQHRAIDHKIGPSCRHPETHYKRNADGTYERPGGPEYIYVTIRGVTDVVEFNGRNNVIRMSDDSTLLQEAKAAVARGECRQEP